MSHPRPTSPPGPRSTANPPRARQARGLARPPRPVPAAPPRAPPLSPAAPNPIGPLSRGRAWRCPPSPPREYLRPSARRSPQIPPGAPASAIAACSGPLWFAPPRPCTARPPPARRRRAPSPLRDTRAPPEHDPPPSPARDPPLPRNRLAIPPRGPASDRPPLRWLRRLRLCVVRYLHRPVSPRAPSPRAPPVPPPVCPRAPPARATIASRPRLSRAFRHPRWRLRSSAPPPPRPARRTTRPLRPRAPRARAPGGHAARVRGWAGGPARALGTAMAARRPPERIAPRSGPARAGASPAVAA